MTTRTLICFALMSPAFPAAAFHIHVHGVVTHYFTGDPLAGVQVRMVKDGVERETMITKGNGRYEFILDRGYVYLIWFYRAGWVTKHVRIDATGIPLLPDVPYYDMDLQLTLFEWAESVDLTVFDEPVAMASYRHSVRNLSWNVDYTEAMRPRVQRTMSAYEQAVRGYRSKRRRADDAPTAAP